MIELYTGTPGSGKSLHCAKEIYTKLCRGKNVYANFDINLTIFSKKKRVGQFVYLDNSELDPFLLRDFSIGFFKRNTNGHIIEGQTLLVIDECQILFNSRDWQAKERMAWATFFTQHRKYGYNIILITQFDRLIDRQIRSLVEYQVIHRKASNFKTIGFFLGLLFRGNVFCAVTQWYGVKERIGSEWFVLQKKYARLYDSYKIFGVQTDGGDGSARGPAVVGTPEASKASNIKRKVFSVLKEIKQYIISKTKKEDISEPTTYNSFEEFWNPPAP